MMIHMYKCQFGALNFGYEAFCFCNDAIQYYVALLTSIEFDPVTDESSVLLRDIRRNPISFS